MTMKQIDAGIEYMTETATPEQKAEVTDGAKELLQKAIDEGLDFFLGVVLPSKEGEITITGHGGPVTMLATAECLVTKAQEIRSELRNEEDFISTLKEIFGAGHVIVLDGDGDGFHIDHPDEDTDNN